jgi:hypothetical protein
MAKTRDYTHRPEIVHGITEKGPLLYTGAPVVVIPIFPVWAAGGTDTVICESESTLKFVVTTLPNVTFEVCFRVTP